MIMSKAFNHLLAMLVATFFLAACAPQPPVPEDNFYRLPRATLTPVKKPLTKKLSVSRFVTDGLHSERALLYTEAASPLQLRQYHYHHWLDSPPRMLQEHLISALRTANIAKTVVNYEAGMRDSLRLGGKIRNFEHLRQGDKAKINIDLELRLEDTRGKLLFLKDYRVEQAATSVQPRDLVQAYGAALQVVYGEFITDWSASQ
jgi:ABC-type uncharacterized transport system auxiliary subunit